MDPVVADHHLTVDGKPRAIVGIEHEGVVAICRNFQEPLKHVSEGLRSQRRGDADVEEICLRNTHVLRLELVKVGQCLPGVAVEAEAEVVEIAACHAASLVLLPGHPHPLLDVCQLLLGLIAALLQVGQLRLVGLACGFIREERPLDVGVGVPHRREVVKEGEQAVVVLL